MNFVSLLSWHNRIYEQTKLINIEILEKTKHINLTSIIFQSPLQIEHSLNADLIN